MSTFLLFSFCASYYTLSFRPEQMIKRTDDDMRREFGYIAAGQITQKLLDKGLITPGEFDKIMAKNREKFSPAIAKIMP